MVYSNKFVLCVLVDGHVQKELANGEVQIPFNTPYVLRFRNKNNRRAVVKFSIDGEDVSGNGYIIPANSFVDIERHNHRDASFILVPLDSPEAVDAGKNGPNLDKSKGVIEAKFFLEKKIDLVQFRPIPMERDPGKVYPYVERPSILPKFPPYSPTGPTLTCLGKTRKEEHIRHRGVTASLQSCCVPTQEGCTVEGNVTGQSFTSRHIDIEKDSVTLKVFLTGYHKEHVAVPLAVPYSESISEQNEALRRQIADLEQDQKSWEEAQSKDLAEQRQLQNRLQLLLRQKAEREKLANS